jgi:hypothetical protein
MGNLLCCVLGGTEAEREKSMAKGNSKSHRSDETLQNSNVSDQLVSQVSKAALRIVKLRQSLEETMATAQTDDERESLASQVETDAIRAIGEQGLTIDEYNGVISAAQSDPELEERVLIACKALN